MATILVRKTDPSGSDKAGMAMDNAVPFRNSNRTFRGEPMSPRSGALVFSGRMPHEDAERLADATGVDYVVWSYSTPIAWHDEQGWHVPDARYSPTTSQHQGTVRVAIAKLA